MRDIVTTDVTRNLPIELVNKIMLYRPPNACVSQLNYYKKEWLYQINREYLFRFHGTIIEYMLMKNLQKKLLDIDVGPVTLGEYILGL